MLKTIQHNDKDVLVVVAKLLTGYVSVTKKVADTAAFISEHETYDAGFVAHVCAWQSNHSLTSDGVIGKATWTALAKEAPTCSTSKLKTSAITLACQLLLGGNLTADAIFGTRTKQAVAAFQSSAGLSADGICGPKTWGALIGVKDEPIGKIINPYIHYLQWDKRWGSKMYSNHGDKKQTIGNSGCGPSAVAQVVAQWVDPKLTPVEMCQLALDNGYRTKNSGTNGAFCEFIADKYPEIEKCTRTRSVKTIKNALQKGALAVTCMNSNCDHFWTTGGHYVTAVGYDDKGYIYAADPNKSSCPRKQKDADFENCLKQAWILWPAKKEEETHDPFERVDDGLSTGTDTPALTRGSAIIDISKYQPTVNYDKVIATTSLIILRAGYRGTGGGISEDQKFELHASELKKRGVRFGVYFFSIASNEDKAREEARMFFKYAKDYDPLFWAMDAENNTITNAAIAAFADELRKLGAKRVGCYVAHNLYNKYAYDSLRNLFDFTWIPRYGKNTGTIEGSTKPSYPCDLWQYTSSGWVDGITEEYTYKDEDGNTLIGIRYNVDLNTITGTGKTLTWFLGGEE